MFKLIIGIIVIAFVLYLLYSIAPIFGQFFAELIAGLIGKIVLIILIPIVVLLFIWGLIKIIKHSSSKPKTIVHTYKIPDLPEVIRPISGSFICTSCGGTTVLKDETNPKPTCCYCGTKLEDLDQLIILRYAELNEERKRKDQLTQKAFTNDSCKQTVEKTNHK